MNFKVVFFVGFLFIFSFEALGKEPVWFTKIKQVKLLSDTYDDMIRMFGDPIDGTSERELSEYFDIEGGRLSVVFESGLCVVTPYSDGKPIGWKVPKWTVISISFDPKKPISRKKLKIDYSGFRKYEIKDVPGAYVYENDETGMDFSVTRDNRIESVGFYPAKKFQHLHCD